MGTTNVAVIAAFHMREVIRGIVSSIEFHLTLTKAKTMLSFPVGVENEQLRSTSSINDTFSGSCPENVSFFYVVHLIFTTPFFYHSNLVCKGKINNVKPVFGIS
ncbi:MULTISPECIES: hypothetical protein [Exiguobacterium]|uniref:Uncharacterized protein n=1 Tax=Exiguobacterium indicum TaxID=296995 RepID=A0AAW3MD03_9BACL|nr:MULTISPECIES: hypothetical protein [Exiguobacterium]KTR26943.1 hypothetical protein RSA11_08140 [Exiguobacterium indicum]